jgi:hypothetical protein
MLGLPNVQADREIRPVWRYVFKQLVELLEWIRLEPIKVGIQFIKAEKAIPMAERVAGCDSWDAFQ